jgi:hypothetical protein
MEKDFSNIISAKHYWTNWADERIALPIAGIPSRRNRQILRNSIAGRLYKNA